MIDFGGLLCDMGFSLIATSWGYSVAVSGLLTAVAYLTAEHVLRGTRAAVLAAHGLSSAVPRLLEHRLSSCGTDLAACGSSQIRDRTHVFCIGRRIFLPLSHQGSPLVVL